MKEVLQLVTVYIGRLLIFYDATSSTLLDQTTKLEIFYRVVLNIVVTIIIITISISAIIITIIIVIIDTINIDLLSEQGLQSLALNRYGGPMSHGIWDIWCGWFL
jgi:hypothetical protein